jgi:hypothetical protein
MKTKLTIVSLAAGAVLLAIASIHMSWGQQSGYGESGYEEGDGKGGYGMSGGGAGASMEMEGEEGMYGDGYGYEGGMYSTGGGDVLNSTRAQIAAKAKELRAAKTDEAKDEAKKATQTLLDSYFEADMKKREREIADIEARVKRLRAQLQKRRAAKDEIVQLQLKVIVNEAEGLGFFSAPPSNSAGMEMGMGGDMGGGMGGQGMGGGYAPPGGGFF